MTLQRTRLTRLHAALIMSKVIGRITKQQRRDERADIGKLSDLVVKPGTLAKYHQHFNQFHDWAEGNGYPLNSSLEVDTAAAQFVEALWADGCGRAEASYLLASIQYMCPSLRHSLPLSWRLVKTWHKHELPTRAVPLDAATALAYAGLFWVWGEHRLSAGILLGFDFFLRTGELFLLRRAHVELFPRCASLQLLQTKSSSLRIHSERLMSWDHAAFVALKFLVANLQPNDPLIGISAQRFRILWHRATKFLLLSEYNIQPYSLRRGGATTAFRHGIPFETIMVRGRWSRQRTCRIYLDEALQQSTLLTFSPESLVRLRWARSQLPIAFGSKGRVEGPEGVGKTF